MSRTDYGSGSVSARPRKDGRFVATLSVDGRRYFAYARTRTEARRKLAELRAARARGEPLVQSRVTVGDWLTTWLTGRKGRVTPQTWENREIHVRRHLVPVIGSLRLAELAADDIRGLFTDSQLAPGTQRVVLRTLSQALTAAVDEDLLRKSPARLVGLPRKPASIGQALSIDQARTLLRGVRGEPHEALYVLLLTTAARVGELLALNWQDVDLERNVVRIHATLVRTHAAGLQVSPETKTRQNRVARLLPVAAAVLERCYPPPRSGPLFLRPDGVRLDGTYFARRHLYPLLVRLGLPRIRPHDLRHSVNTLLAGEGVDPTVRAAMLGHASLDLQSTYTHATAAMTAQAAAVLERLLAGAEDTP